MKDEDKQQVSEKVVDLLSYAQSKSTQTTSHKKPNVKPLTKPAAITITVSIHIQAGNGDGHGIGNTIIKTEN